MPDCIHAIEQIICPNTMSIDLTAIDNSFAKSGTINTAFKLPKISNHIARIDLFDSLDSID